MIGAKLDHRPRNLAINTIAIPALLTERMVLRWVAPIALCLLAWFMPRWGDPWLARIERWGIILARKRWAAVFVVGAVAILIRVALLPVLPVPVPDTHDEFSYLLAADTFAHGRLTNPPQALSVYFDTFHVLQRPTYQSIYPPAQSAVLALGQVLGHPWIGVLLSMGTMCAAITWMLQAWLPAEWALLGGLVVILRIHLFSYWLEGYWGGAVAATGGALVMGAFPKIMQKQRARDAVVMGIGLTLLANSRPFEGAILGMTVAIALLAWAISKHAPSYGVTLRRILLPVVWVMVPAVASMGYYNWRVTGDAFLFPHTLDQRQYQAISPFVWKTSSFAPFWHLQDATVRVYSNPQFDDFYNGMARDASRSSVARLSLQKLEGCEEFFLGSVLWIALLGTPWVLKDRRTRFLLVQFAICALGLLTVYWFNPHYAAPVTATGIALLMQSMRHLRRWEIQRRPIGVFLTRLVLAMVMARVAVYIYRPPAMKASWSWSRAQISSQLRNMPGNHLVLVRYAPGHDPNDEWVFNAADIDHSRIVWARDIPDVDPAPLLDYFADRKIWSLDADALHPRLSPFRMEETRPALSANGGNTLRGRP